MMVQRSYLTKTTEDDQKETEKKNHGEIKPIQQLGLGKKKASN